MAQSEKMRYNANVSEILSLLLTIFTKKEKRSKKEKITAATYQGFFDIKIMKASLRSDRWSESSGMAG